MTQTKVDIQSDVRILSRTLILFIEVVLRDFSGFSQSSQLFSGATEKPTTNHNLEASLEIKYRPLGGVHHVKVLPD